MCGFPRTGTHWIRQVVEKSTGHKTCNMYEDKPTYVDKKVLLIKIHARSRRIAYVKALLLLPAFKFGGKYIYVYRDPRDAIISLYEMYRKLKNLPNLDETKFLSVYDPIRQYQWEINSWVLSNQKNVLIVKFEELKRSPNNVFKKIFDYIGVNAEISENAVKKMVATSDSKIRPRGTIYGWKKTSGEYQNIITTVSYRLKRNRFVRL